MIHIPKECSEGLGCSGMVKIQGRRGTHSSRIPLFLSLGERIFMFYSAHFQIFFSYNFCSHLLTPQQLEEHAWICACDNDRRVFWEMEKVRDLRNRNGSSK